MSAPAITLVDYGVGNVRAFANYYRRTGVDVATASTPGELLAAARVVLPGVGSFDHAMRELDRSGMRPALEELALQRRVPVLGVCVGMQMLTEGSEEGKEAGLGWVKGRVRRLPAHGPDGSPLPLPHMGWNTVRPVADAGVFAGMGDEPRFYFLHSYFVEVDDARQATATVEYGERFCCALAAGNLHGVQFHPEKSHRWGAALLSNFAALP